MSAALSNDETAYTKTWVDKAADFCFVTATVAFAGVGIWLAFNSQTVRSVLYPPTVALLDSHVQIDSQTGHGSATHIGNGLFVTAAHVVNGTKFVKIGDTELEVLWLNTAYDVALLRGPETDYKTTPMVCDTPKVGAIGVSYGNPMQLADIQTTVRVAGVAQAVGLWKVAIPVDGSIGPGMSGGAFEIDGKLVGINVGAFLAPANGFPSFYGLSAIVPSSVICSLMGWE